MAGLSLDILCLVKPTLLTLPQGLCQQPRLHMVASGPPEMVTLSQGLPATHRETSGVWVLQSIYTFHAIHGSLSGFFPAHQFGEM